MSTHRNHPAPLLAAARALDHVAATRPDLGADRHTVQDIADLLAGRRPDPGSPYAEHEHQHEPAAGVRR
ncbi:hypothetical protein BJF78_32730 [Pseudonocardia sp. CNS-139]|nr:hypothetical protein BJF78_32730 [Pseudonocardia sp. CNS-139]